MCVCVYNTVFRFRAYQSVDRRRKCTHENEKKKRTQRGRDSVGIEIFEKGLEARGVASTREYTCLYIIMTEGEKRTG